MVTVLLLGFVGSVYIKDPLLKNTGATHVAIHGSSIMINHFSQADKRDVVRHPAQKHGFFVTCY